jgi:hypothetical protein
MPFPAGDNFPPAVRRRNRRHSNIATPLILFGSNTPVNPIYFFTNSAKVWFLCAPTPPASPASPKGSTARSSSQALLAFSQLHAGFLPEFLLFYAEG